MIVRSSRASALRGAALLVLLCWPEPGHADELAVATYVRTDSDDTLVVAPRVRASLPLAESTAVSATYAVDAWTSASIDIRTSASVRPVTEQRDELDVSVDQELTDVTLTLGYRLSYEPDYVSHGVSGGLGYDFADNNATLALGLFGSTDSVGKAGDPHYSQSVGTLGARLTFTQVLAIDSLAQVQYEVSRAQGFLASPYRWVAIGGESCVDRQMPSQIGISPLCPTEHNPDERLRHALSVFARRAFGKHASLGAGYRLYFDDWGLGAHTVRAEAAWLPGADTTLSLRYRLYLQGAADHYRAMYDEPQPYVTNDKELSPLTSHRIGLDLEQRVAFLDDRELTLTLSGAPVFYAYSDFTPLTSITAVEISIAIGAAL